MCYSYQVNFSCSSLVRPQVNSGINRVHPFIHLFVWHNSSEMACTNFIIFYINIKYDLGMMHGFLKLRYCPRRHNGCHVIAQKTVCCNTTKIQKIAVLVKIRYYTTLLCIFTSYCQISNWAQNGRLMTILLLEKLILP